MPINRSLQIKRLKDKEGNTGYEKLLTESQKTEIIYLILSSSRWTKKFEQLAKKSFKKIGRTMNDGDLEKAERVEAECLEKLSTKATEDFTLGAWKLIKDLTEYELHPDDKILRDHLLLVRSYRSACVELEIDPIGYIYSPSLQPLLGGLWRARHNADRNSDEVLSRKSEKVWKGCLEHIGKKISQKPWQYPDYNRSLMLNSHYKFLHKEMKALCKSYPGATGIKRREVVCKAFPELKEVYERENPKGNPYQYQQDKPSYYARNLIAKWNRTSFRTLERQLKTANKHIKYFKKAGIDYDPYAFDRFAWELIHNQKQFDWAVKFKSGFFEMVTRSAPMPE